jgi:hypothetical protein
MMQHHPNQNSCLSDSILSLPMNLICGCVWKPPKSILDLQNQLRRVKQRPLCNGVQKNQPSSDFQLKWQDQSAQHIWFLSQYIHINVVLTRANSTILSSKGEQVHGTRTIDHKLVKASAIDVKDQSIHLRYWASPFEVVCICLRLHHTNAKAHISWSRFNTN